MTPNLTGAKIHITHIYQDMRSLNEPLVLNQSNFQMKDLAFTLAIIMSEKLRPKKIYKYKRLNNPKF